MTILTSDVFTTMSSDLERVEARVESAATIDLPFVSSLVADLVQAGGKRLRPLLLLLAGRSYVYDLDRLVTAAAGVELLHTASLIHDDNIDRSELRRGRPTLNAHLNSGAVILIGDYLFAQSAMLAAATEHTRVVAIFASTLGDICDGQLREMFDAHQLDQSRAQYERRIYGKTASLFAAAAEMGAVIGQAPADHISALRAFGGDVGMAFQIVDDVLDLRVGTHLLGKPTGQDLRQGTVTLPIMIFADALGMSDPKRESLERVVSGDEENEAEIEELLLEVRSSGALETAERVAAGFVERAKDRLDIVEDPETREFLDQLADLALNRAS
ncbi:MAG: polyprenyl synthetase family protein [Chloroflexota bacterium]|nr:polyprenyl synthetase family protein [Chloroflexota bacterium]